MKTYTIEINSRGQKRTVTDTLQGLIKYFKYVLDVGYSWQNESGNKQINKNPKSIKSLVENLNNAKRNVARNGDPDTWYNLLEN